MRSIIGLAALLVGGCVTACLLLELRNGLACESGISAAACLGRSIGHLQHDFAMAAAIAAITIALLAVSTLVQVRRHGRVARSLQQSAHTAWLADHEVGLVPGLGAPCVAGLARTLIYCPPDLAERLTEDELRAVILHEHHHQVTHAPARLVLLAALRPVLRLLPGGRGWVERRRGAIEIAADDHAISSGVRRSVLARALMELALPTTDPSLAGYASASEIRLRHLVGDESPGIHGMTRLAFVAVPLVALVGCLLRGPLT